MNIGDKLRNLSTDTFLSRWRRLRNISGSYLKSTYSKNSLPPGDLSRYDRIVVNDRLFLLRRYEEFGEIFKLTWHEQFLICVVGLETSRKMLNEHSDELKPISVELSQLFPSGFIRNMEGKTHRKYRTRFVTAIKAEVVGAIKEELSAIISDGLSEVAEKHSGNTNSADAYIKTLNIIATGLLIRIFFGVQFRSAEFRTLIEKYALLGPKGFVWNIGNSQRKVYFEILDFVKTLNADQSVRENQDYPSCILTKLGDKEPLDQTAFGNLIYMVEMGRFDLYSLFRWLTKFIVDNPKIIPGLADENGSSPSISNAFVLETLRMEQSEGVFREASKDFVFKDFLIPKGAMVRLCLWEPHKFSDPFTDPFKFDAERFLNKDFDSDQYSPFGLDHHHCPAGDIVVRLSSMFVQTLAGDFDIECLDDGPPIKGVYHWEPSERFRVRLRKKSDQLA